MAAAGTDVSHAIVDGVPMALADVRVPFSDPAVTHGLSVFETLRVGGGAVRRVDRHLDRLAASCRATDLHMPPRDVLAAEIAAAAAMVAAPLVRVRVTITGGGMRIVTAEASDPARIHRPVRAVRGVHDDDAVLPGWVKHGSRASWVVAERRSGADVVLLVDRDRRFTEGTTCAVLALIDGVLWTAPEDGRILPSTACADVLDRARVAGVPVRREGPPADGPWDGLFVASSLRDVCPVASIDGVPITSPLPAWARAVAS